MKIKFCGMTNLDDCLYAQDLGVDYVGFVFYKKSKRHIQPEIVGNIVEHLNLETVGVFVDALENEILQIMEIAHLSYAQIYDDLPIRKSIRAYRISDALPEKISDGLILLDSFSDSIGGSAKNFDWGLLKNFKAIDRAFIAGGVSIENVAEIAKYKPYGVDLVSSVESCPGKKDFKKMKAFVNLVRSLG